MITLLSLLALAGEPKPPAVPVLADVVKLVGKDWSRKQLLQVEAAAASTDAATRLIAVAMLYTDNPDRWREALTAEWRVGDAEAKAAGRIEAIAPQDVQAETSKAALRVPSGAPTWVPACASFVVWRGRAAYVQTPAETVNVPRLFRKACADGVWAKEIEKGRFAVLGLLDGLDTLEVVTAP